MVLIETLWNVNRGQVIATPVENIVLIETLWNVNRKSLLVSFLVRQRINRNIVECKLVHKTTAIIVCNVLIETLWNVNLNDTHCFLQQVPVLIETLWNVNTT